MKPRAGSASRDRRANRVGAVSPVRATPPQPSLVSTTSASASSTARRVATSRSTSPTTSASHTNRTSSSAIRHAVARPGTRSASSAAGAAHAVTAPITRSAISGTEPLPTGVVEGRRDDRGGRRAGPEVRGERAADAPEPPERDRGADRLGACRGGDTAHHAAGGQQRHAARGLAVDPETHELPLEGDLSHPLQGELADEVGLVRRDGPPEPELLRVIVGKRVLRQVEMALLEPEDVER